MTRLLVFVATIVALLLVLYFRILAGSQSEREEIKRYYFDNKIEMEKYIGEALVKDHNVRIILLFRESKGSAVSNMFYTVVYDTKDEVVLDKKLRSVRWNEEIKNIIPDFYREECGTASYIIENNIYIIRNQCS